jgi:hypothetical protein
MNSGLGERAQGTGHPPVIYLSRYWHASVGCLTSDVYDIVIDLRCVGGRRNHWLAEDPTYDGEDVDWVKGVLWNMVSCDQC